MHHKTGAKRNLRKIGEELGVAHVLEGAVQRSGNRVRVNAQLIDARSDAHLWAQTLRSRSRGRVRNSERNRQGHRRPITGEAFTKRKERHQLRRRATSLPLSSTPAPKIFS